MLTKQSEMQSQVILISSLNKGVLNSYVKTILNYNKITTIFGWAVYPSSQVLLRVCREPLFYLAPFF